MTGVALELRRGPGKLLVVPLIALGVFFVWQFAPPGPAVWPMVVSGVAFSASLMGPVAGGFGALAGTRSHRRRTGSMELLAARSVASAGLTELAALLIWVSVAYIVVVGVALLAASRSAAWSGPDPLRTVVIGLGVLLHVVPGYLLGRVIPSRLTPPFVAVALYGISVVNTTSRSGHAWSLFLPINLHETSEFDRFTLGATVGQLVWYVGLGLLVTVVWVLRRDGPSARRLGALVAAAAVTAAGVVVLLPSGGDPYASGTFMTWTCAGTRPQICIHPALRTARPGLTRVIEPVARRLDTTPFAIARAEQRTRGIGSIPTAGAVGFALDDTAPSSLRRVGQELAVNALMNPDACFGADGPATGYELEQLVATWVAGTPGLFGPSSPAEAGAQRWFDGLDRPRRTAWFAAHEQAIRTCSLTAAAFH